LVMQADGLTDLLVELPAGLNVVRRKPAAHAFILQTFVQTVSKLLVPARIADEAGVELDGPFRHRAYEVNELIGNTGPTQEDFWDFALGAIDRIYADGGRPFMAHGPQ